MIADPGPGAPEPRPLGPRPRPPVWRTVVVMVGAAFMSLSSAVFSELGQGSDGVGAALALLALALPVALCWRHRAPLILTLATAGVAIAAPVGPWVTLTLLASLLTYRRDRHTWWALGAATVATIVAFVRDLLAPTKAESLLKDLVGPTAAAPNTPVEVSWWVLPIAVVIVVGLFTGIGLLRRARREARRADERTVAADERTMAAEGRSALLDQQVARQQEREQIAREVHDALGHQLSLLSLHAGALEVSAADAPLSSLAHQIRASAARAGDDLHTLLQMLREDPETLTATNTPRLTDLPDMIDRTATAGIPVTATVYLDHSDDAAPALARAVYRVVQELLTNALKYAAGPPIRLLVTGGPDHGVTIETTNPYDPAGAATQARERAGLGLVGIAERVDALGGHLAYGVDNEGTVFRVTVTLPWQ